MPVNISLSISPKDSNFRRNSAKKEENQKKFTPIQENFNSNTSIFEEGENVERVNLSSMTINLKKSLGVKKSNKKYLTQIKKDPFKIMGIQNEMGPPISTSLHENKNENVNEFKLSRRKTKFFTNIEKDKKKSTCSTNLALPNFESDSSYKDSLSDDSIIDSIKFILKIPFNLDKFVQLFNENTTLCIFIY